MKVIRLLAILLIVFAVKLNSVYADGPVLKATPDSLEFVKLINGGVIGKEIIVEASGNFSDASFELVLTDPNQQFTVAKKPNECEAIISTPGTTKVSCKIIVLFKSNQFNPSVNGAPLQVILSSKENANSEVRADGVVINLKGISSLFVGTGNPDSLNFGKQIVGKQSAPQTVSFSLVGLNAFGGRPFDVSVTPEIVGDNKDEFSIDAGTCLSTVASTSFPFNCEIKLTYTPTKVETIDPNKTQLKMTFGPIGSPQEVIIPLSGTAESQDGRTPPVPSDNSANNGGGCSLAMAHSSSVVMFLLLLAPLAYLGWRRVRE